MQLFTQLHVLICPRGVNWDTFVYPTLVISGPRTVPVPFHLYTYVFFTPTSISYRSSRCLVFSFCNSYQQVQLEPNKATVRVLFMTPSILPSEIIRKCIARSSCSGQNIWCLIIIVSKLSGKTVTSRKRNLGANLGTFSMRECSRL